MNTRIGLVVPALERGGGVPSVAEFVCKTLEQAGEFDVELVSLATAARDEIGVALSRPWSWLRGVRTCKGVWRGRAFTRVGAFASELEIQRFQPRRALADLLVNCDLIQVVSGSPAAACSVCGLGKPVALQCATRAIIERRRPSATGRGPIEAWRRWMTRITDQLDRNALRTVDAIQLENPWMFSYAQEINALRDVIIRYAPPGVDAGRFRPAALRDLRSDPYVLCVGRLDDPRKNIELLLEAYASLPPGLIQTTRLVLAGLMGPTAAFWARVRALRLTERVKYVSCPDAVALVRLYQGASVFALSSDEEGLGMVILEAMACGVPVVSTRSGGPDGIISEGKDGYLVGLDDATAMADRLARLLVDDGLNRRMGEGARETIMSRYEAGVAGRAFLDIYDELLSRPRLRPAGGRYYRGLRR